jgi:hypothetical protein
VDGVKEVACCLREYEVVDPRARMWRVIELGSTLGVRAEVESRSPKISEVQRCAPTTHVLFDYQDVACDTKPTNMDSTPALARPARWPLSRDDKDVSIG